jgi:hypothetical protein
VRRLIYTGASALIASGVSIGSASAATTAARFGFTYATSYGAKHCLSQRYAGPITTGQSYDTGVAIRASDTGQKAYSLVEANPNVGVGGLRGAFPAISRTLSASSSTPKYLGSYYILRRTSNGTVDTTFGDHGYVSAFGNNTDSSYNFTSLHRFRHGAHRMRWDVTRPQLTAIATLTTLTLVTSIVLSAQKVNLAPG